MTEPADKQRRYNDYISRFSDVRERELRMVHDVCEAEAERDALLEEQKEVQVMLDECRGNLREIKRNLEGRP